MNPIAGKIFTSYLLFPIIAFLMGFVVILVAKKNKLLQDKKAIFYLLLSGCILSVPGLLGYLEVGFMPYGYLICQVLYLIVGFINLRLLLHFVRGLNEKAFGFTYLLLIVQVVIGWALFSVWFNLTNDFQYGIWAGSCILSLLVLPLFKETFNVYLKIPVEIYKMRIYSAKNIEYAPAPIDTEEFLVYEIEIYKTLSDRKPIRLKAKSTGDLIFGDWFELIISDYNQKKASNPIDYFDSESPYGWIFYTKPSFFKPRKYIDPDISFQENNLQERHLIVSKRVKQSNITQKDHEL